MARKAHAKQSPRKSGRRRAPRAAPRRWSKRVTETSNALDLEQSVFTKRSARDVALSLKRSAERSRRRKADPFRSAMSMLNLYINRAGKNLTPTRKRTLERAKGELRKAFGREPKS
ncbi:MAG: DUF3175 domain-containing protein [Gemmatimonadales bacterium]